MNYPHGKTTFLSASFGSVCVQLSTPQLLLLLSSPPVKLFVLICQRSLAKIKLYHRTLKEIILPSCHEQFPLLNSFCASLVANSSLEMGFVFAQVSKYLHSEVQQYNEIIRELH